MAFNFSCFTVLSRISSEILKKNVDILVLCLSEIYCNNPMSLATKTRDQNPGVIGRAVTYPYHFSLDTESSALPIMWPINALPPIPATIKCYSG